MNQVRRNGFTLVELMLAMTFISVLLVAIAMCVIQISTIYNRGITFKVLNQTGRAVTADIRRTVAASPVFPVEGVGNKFIEQAYGGRLCTGQYTYVWNNADALTEYKTNSAADLNRFEGEDTPRFPIKFIRTFDPRSTYCLAPTSRIIKSPDTVELLDVTDRVLAIHDFDIRSSASAIDIQTAQQLYTISILIGTEDTDQLSGAPGEDANCRVDGDIDYCAINRFTLTARAGNRVQ